MSDSQQYPSDHGLIMNECDIYIFLFGNRKLTEINTFSTL